MSSSPASVSGSSLSSLDTSLKNMLHGNECDIQFDGDFGRWRRSDRRLIRIVTVDQGRSMAMAGVTATEAATATAAAGGEMAASPTENFFAALLEWKDVCAWSFFVCAFAADSLYRDRRNWDERDRGDPADDGVFGLGIGPAAVAGDGAAGGAGGAGVRGPRGGECGGQRCGGDQFCGERRRILR